MSAVWQAVLLISLAAPPAAPPALRVRVTDFETGAPLEDARVLVFAAEESGPAAAGRTGEQGEAEFGRLPPGALRVVASAAGYAEAAWILPSGTPAELEFPMLRLGVVTGRVTSASGTPMPGTLVTLMAESAEGEPVRLPPEAASQLVAVAGASGSYRLHGIPPGRYVAGALRILDSQSDGGASSLTAVAAPARRLSIVPGRPEITADFVLPDVPAGRLRGRVEWPADRGAVLVTLTPAEFPAMPVLRVVADGHGNFEFPSVPAGEYFLSAAGPSLGPGGRSGILGPGAAFAVRRVTVSPGSTAEVDLEPGQAQTGWLRIETKEAHGARPCASQTELRLYPSIGVGAQLDHRQPVTTGARTAVLLFPGLPYAAALESPIPACAAGSSPQLVRKDDPASREHNIRLAPCASLEGRIQSTSGRPGDFAALLWPETGASSKFSWIAVLPDESGNFEAACLPPGTYRALAVPLPHRMQRGWNRQAGAGLEVELFASGKARIELTALVPEQ